MRGTDDGAPPPPPRSSFRQRPFSGVSRLQGNSTERLYTGRAHNVSHVDRDSSPTAASPFRTLRHGELSHEKRTRNPRQFTYSGPARIRTVILRRRQISSLAAYRDEHNFARIRSEAWFSHRGASIDSWVAREHDPPCETPCGVFVLFRMPVGAHPRHHDARSRVKEIRNRTQHGENHRGSGIVSTTQQT